MSVSIGPGEKLLTVIPRARSRARPRDSLSRADSLITETAPPAKGIRSAFLVPIVTDRLRVNGHTATGSSAVFGVLRDGRRTGRPGSDYVTTLTINNLVLNR